MTPQERRSVITVAGLYGLRMLGLFMILPILSLYQDKLASATPLLIGFALGVYGLTQAFLQLPFGMLSDRIGRKPVLLMGIGLFAVGSLVAALGDDIYQLILGRALQGSGAIASVLMALLADQTRSEQRTKATAMVGMSIGLAFAMALVLGPLLSSAVGLIGVFWVCVALALMAFIVVIVFVPHLKPSSIGQINTQFSDILKDFQLLRLDFGVFILHFILTASFIVIPMILRDIIGLAEQQHMWVYLAVLLMSFVIMLPILIWSDRNNPMKLMLFAIAMLAFSVLILGKGYHYSALLVYSLLLLFFIAFNLLEALLPSLASKLAPTTNRGAALGLFSTSQFLGAFCGGMVGGWLLGQYGISSVFFVCAALAIIWWLASLSIQLPVFRTEVLDGD